MPEQRDYDAAKREQAAREAGRTLSHYAGKVAKKLSTPAKRSGTTPSKKAGRER
ncbi:MAG: hypothetical protein ACXW3Z_00975 [Limisphaerales bacterium]